MTVDPATDIEGLRDVSALARFVADGERLTLGGRTVVFEVPDGLVLTDLVALRLARRLAHAPEGTGAVVAAGVVAPPGSSIRAVTERECQRPDGALREAGEPGTWRGCTARFEGERREGPILLDPLAHCLDLNAPLPAPLDATAAGRSLFPHGPLTLLVACGDDPAVAALGRRWSNGLMSRGIEVRLAVEEPSEGAHLTTPCLPSAATIDGLRPEVIVALDAAAGDQVSRWAQGLHAAQIHVTSTPVGPSGVETVSWRIGSKAGELRARTSPEVSLDALADLVNRLPGLPPVRSLDQLEAARPGRNRMSAGGMIPRRRKGAVRPRVTSVEIVGRTRSNDEALWWSGLVDQLSALGCSVDVCGSAGVRRSASSSADLRLLGTTALQGASTPMASATLAAVLVSHHDLDGSPRGSLSASTRSAVESVGAALAPSRNVEEALADAGVAVRRLAPFIGRERLRDLRSASFAARSGRAPVIGWHIGGSVSLAELQVVRAGFEPVLAAHPQLTVEVSSDEPGLSQALSGGQIRAVSTPIDAQDLARRRLQVWSAGSTHVASTGLFGSALDALLAAVPLVATSQDATSLGAMAHAVTTPSETGASGSWTETLTAVLDGAHADLGRAQVQARMLFDDQAAAVAAHRVLGWLVHRSAQ